MDKEESVLLSEEQQERVLSKENDILRFALYNTYKMVLFSQAYMDLLRTHMSEEEYENFKKEVEEHGVGSDIEWETCFDEDPTDNDILIFSLIILDVFGNETGIPTNFLSVMLGIDEGRLIKVLREHPEVVSETPTNLSLTSLSVETEEKMGD